jgi:carboxyl-terminal processing protease
MMKQLISIVALIPITNMGQSPTFEEAMFDGMRTFARVLEITEKRHYNIKKPNECITESIRSFLSCLDPHSTYLDSKTYKRMLEMSNGEFFGIGVIIDNTRTDKDKALLVIDTIAEGPADKAGLIPFDKIVEIDDQPLEGRTTDELVTNLKGERNTKVTVKVMREGKQDLLSFTITRDVIQEQQSLCFYMPDQDIYYLSLSIFADNAVKQLESLLKASSHKKFKGLILDLRNNIGGLLEVAVDIMGLFVSNNSLVVSIRDKTNAITNEYLTHREPVMQSDIPIFILINNYTASAAEILAGGLRQHSGTQNGLMIFLVGTPSFGKGSVQEVIPLGNDSALKLTTALYFLPEGNTIQGSGIIPDFEVEPCMPQPEQVQWFKKFYGREKNLTNSIASPNAISEKEKKERQTSDKKKWIDKAKESLEKDAQVRATITLLNILNFAKRVAPELVSTRVKAVKLITSIVLSTQPLGLVEIRQP